MTVCIVILSRYFLENIRTVPILQVEIRHTYVEVFRDCLKFI